MIAIPLILQAIHTSSDSIGLLILINPSLWHAGHRVTVETPSWHDADEDHRTFSHSAFTSFSVNVSPFRSRSMWSSSLAVSMDIFFFCFSTLTPHHADERISTRGGGIGGGWGAESGVVFAVSLLFCCRNGRTQMPATLQACRVSHETRIVSYRTKQSESTGTHQYIVTLILWNDTGHKWLSRTFTFKLRRRMIGFRSRSFELNTKHASSETAVKRPLFKPKPKLEMNEKLASSVRQLEQISNDKSKKMR